MKFPVLLMMLSMVFAGILATPAASADCIEYSGPNIYGQECVELVTGLPDRAPYVIWLAKCVVIEQLGGTCPPPP